MNIEALISKLRMISEFCPEGIATEVRIANQSLTRSWPVDDIEPRKTRKGPMLFLIIEQEPTLGNCRANWAKE